MDIESKTYRVRSIGGGLLSVERKSGGAGATVAASEFPSAAALAAMHERDFNRACESAICG